MWNSIWNKGIVPELYLDFASDNQYTFSFASSFGRLKIEEDEILVTKPWFIRMNKISVREESAKEILCNQYNVHNVETLLDPTLLLSASEWKELECITKIDVKYILIYNLFRSKEFDDYAKKLSEKTGLKLVVSPHP